MMSTLEQDRALHRGSWSRPQEKDDSSNGVNVGATERVVTAMIGGALAATGLSLAGQRRTPGAVLSGLALAGAGAAMLRRGATGHCAAYEALGVTQPGGKLSNPFTRGVKISASIVIDRPADEVYDFYRDFSNLPRIMSGIESIEKLDDAGVRTRWVVNTTPGHAGPSAEWVAVITAEEPGSRIAWESEEGALVTTRGEVRFIEQPHGRGTIVRSSAEYHPVGGVLAAALAKATGSDPRSQMQQDLRRLKAYLETSEVPTTEGQPRGNCAGR